MYWLLGQHFLIISIYYLIYGVPYEKKKCLRKFSLHFKFFFFILEKSFYKEHYRFRKLYAYKVKCFVFQIDSCSTSVDYLEIMLRIF